MLSEELKFIFTKIKKDIDTINLDLSSLKEAISIQNDVLLKLLERISNVEKDQKVKKVSDSIGNKRVNQSINHLNTRDFNLKHMRENIDFEHENVTSTGNDGVKEGLSHVKSDKEVRFEPKIEKEDRNNVFRMAKASIDSAFNGLSKQELKVFLTVYQLEDESQETSYRVIAERMDLSEHCIRAHICALFRKKVPLYKVKLNNRVTLIFVDKDFKSLNLKQKLIGLYYKTDPHQTTLFETYR